MNKIILVEGPDCAGKTTLIESMVNEFTTNGIKTFVQHSSWNKDWDILEYHKTILNSIIQKSKNGYISILDRHWISEQVYSKVFRNNKIYGFDDINEIEKSLTYMYTILKDNNTINILCLPPIDLVLTQFYKRKQQDKEMWDSVKEVYIEYNNMKDKFDYIFDYSKHNTIEFIGKLL